MRLVCHFLLSMKQGGGGRRLLASSYRSYRPRDLGDRYVSFLLNNECTASVLQGRVMMDHLAIIKHLIGEDGLKTNDGDDDNNNSNRHTTTIETGGGGSGTRAGSIEIDAFQLLTYDPVLGNLTLRYPDTLLELLEDATVRARRILHGRMEMALRGRAEAVAAASILDQTAASPSARRNDLGSKNDMVRLLKALQYTKDTYSPRPLRARLVRLPPHSGCCKATLSSITAVDVGTVVQICGTVVRTGPVRMMETTRTYKCCGKICGGMTFVVYADFGTSNNALPLPIICPYSAANNNDSMDGDNNNVGDRCQSTSFVIVSNESENADYQEIKVQESASALSRVGSIPRSILIKLGDDLVDICNPGDEVVIVGHLYAQWQQTSQSIVDGVDVLVGMCMRAHSVRVINADEGGFGGGNSNSSGGSMANLAIAGMSSSGNLREKFRREFDTFWSSDTARRRPMATRDYIARAVCPKLFGMHAVKLGLLLVLIGGASVSSSSSPELENGTREGEDEKEVPNGSDAIDDEPVAFEIGNGDDDEYTVDRKKSSVKNGKSKPNKGTEKKAVKRRIQSHILLIGDPGTGKSQFLRFAAALSPRSVLTTGTGSSTAGLTCAAIRDGNEWTLEAGALALADRGVCCIDEFGCMSKEDRTSIHEAMEQQTISVAKAGIICKLNARATVVAVMNPTSGGIYDESQSLERNSRLGSALLSRFDMIFVMLDQAQCERDINIAHFLLQQSIIPGSGYDRPPHVSTDDSVNGHWGMEKLRAYIATIREKFHPTLTPEASDLLENHYSLCRQQGNSQSLVTVRFLESLIRLSQAHARLMYRDKVLLDDAVAVILLMECTAAASSGAMFRGGCGGGTDYSQFDDCLAKNPIDTEFRPFDEVDAQFDKEKQALLRRYQGGRSNNTTNHQQFNGISPPRFRNSTTTSRAWDNVDQRGGHSTQPSFSQYSTNDQVQRDQWGRQRMSQAAMSQAASPYPNRKSNSIRQAIERIDQNQLEESKVPGNQSGLTRKVLTADDILNARRNNDHTQSIAQEFESSARPCGRRDDNPTSSSDQQIMHDTSSTMRKKRRTAD